MEVFMEKDEMVPMQEQINTLREQLENVRNQCLPESTVTFNFDPTPRKDIVLSSRTVISWNISSQPPEQRPWIENTWQEQPWTTSNFDYNFIILEAGYYQLIVRIEIMDNVDSRLEVQIEGKELIPREGMIRPEVTRSPKRLFFSYLFSVTKQQLEEEFLEGVRILATARCTYCNRQVVNPQRSNVTFMKFSPQFNYQNSMVTYFQTNPSLTPLAWCNSCQETYDDNDQGNDDAEG